MALVLLLAGCGAMSELPGGGCPVYPECDADGGVCRSIEEAEQEADAVCVDEESEISP